MELDRGTGISYNRSDLAQLIRRKHFLWDFLSISSSYVVPPSPPKKASQTQAYVENGDIEELIPKNEKEGLDEMEVISQLDKEMLVVEVKLQIHAFIAAKLKNFVINVIEDSSEHSSLTTDDLPKLN
ncbi:hypothetical protein TNCV_4183761 [Trichonephila clavipes]|nr:hypothetical protein TNCV_4183761 [Trichonephila clavipes]